MKAICALLCLLFLAFVPSGKAMGHALEPGYLEITPSPDAGWQVTWRKPQVSGKPMEIDAVLPEGCSPRRGPAPRFDGRAFVTGWIASCDTPIWEGAVFIDGLAQTATDALVRYVAEDGASPTTLRLTPDAPSVTLPAVPTVWYVLTSYFWLGVDHILGGLDHLLFVFALMLLVPDLRNLVLAITAFTASHSITLAVSSLGLLTLPMPPVEAIIALSIVFLAVEVMNRQNNHATLTQSKPWLVAFAFGLLHGLGFASALKEIGLPEGDVPVALLAFNLGVEAGQLLFVAVVLTAAAMLRRIVPQLYTRTMTQGGPGITIAAYGVGGIAAFWTIDRVLSFFT